MKLETLVRRVAQMDESISRLYAMWAEQEVEIRLLTARLGALAPAIGLSGAGPTSTAPPSLRDQGGDAGGS